LLNKKCNHYEKQKVRKHIVEIENEEQLRLRAGLEKKIKIKEYNNMFAIDNIIIGMRLATEARLDKQTKEEAY